MKKSCVICVLIFFFSMTVFAQSSRIEAGAFGGAGISRTTEYFDYGFSYIGGMQLQYSIGKRFSIVSELSMENRKSSDGITFTDTVGIQSDLKLTHKLNYITIPLLARMYFGENIKYFVNAGPSISYLISQDASTQNNTKKITSESVNFRYFKEWEKALILGVGAEVPLGKNAKLTLELRNKTGRSKNIWDETLKTSSLLLLAGIIFQL